MNGPAYPAARAASANMEASFARYHDAAFGRGAKKLAPKPDAAVIEAIIEAAFWASLRREEGFSPKISLAFLAPEHSAEPMRFERQLLLTPQVLSKLTPAVERHGIHLGFWCSQDTNQELR